ncbi:MAG: hypothetical protein ACK5SX_00395 [Sandaracinobacter sp.]
MTMHQVFLQLAATVHVELAIRLRNRTALVFLFVILGLSTALTPSRSSNYTIIQVGSRAPLLGPDTALLSAGLVLNVLMILIFSFILQIGNARDSLQNLQPLWKTQPLDPRWLTIARALANIVYSIGLCLLIAVILGASIAFKYGDAPSPDAFGIFVLIVLPAITVAVIVGAIVDLMLPPAPLPRTLALFGFWVVLVIVSLGGGFEVLGTNTLNQMLGSEHADEGIGLGFMPIDKQNTFNWHVLPISVWDIMDRQVQAFGSIAAAGLLLLFAIGNFLNRRDLRRSAPHKVKSGGARTAAAITAQDLPGEVPTSPPSLIWNAYLNTITRLYRPSPLSVALLVLAFGLAIAIPGQPRFTIVLAAFVPLILTNRNSEQDMWLAQSLERCEPALQSPKPDFVHGFALAAPMLLAASPAILVLPLIQAITAVCALFFSAFWQTVAHRILATPMLGTAIGCAVLYVFGLNDAPQGFDLIGVNEPGIASMTISALIAVSLVVVTLRR